jgi:hypothetical protein
MKIESIKGDAMRKMMTAMSQTVADAGPMLEDNVASFYSGKPKYYDRTGTLMTSPKVTGPNGGGDACSMSMEMDDSISYNTGLFSGAQVIDATNKGTAGVVGAPGYWDRAEENVKTIADSHFSAAFGR